MKKVNIKSQWTVYFFGVVLTVCIALPAIAETIMEVQGGMEVDPTYNALRVDATNHRVGIGTDTPSETLHVNGSVRGNQSGALRVSTGTGYVDIGPKDTSYSHFYTDRNYFFFSKGLVVDSGTIGSYDETLLFKTGSSIRMALNSSTGNVGVGTITPYDKLDVVSDSTAGGLRLNNAYNGDGDSHIRFLLNDFDKYVVGVDDSDSDKFKISAGSTLGTNDRLVIDSSGNVGIGVSSPTVKLDIDNAIIKLRDSSSAITGGDGYSVLYSYVISNQSRLYGGDESQTNTLLSSHMDPKDVDPSAVDSSFENTNIAMPFSFHHFNKVIGKESVSDMAAVVAEVERMSGKQFTYVRDLPPEERVDYATWQAQQVEGAIAKALSATPEVEISISDAWESVERTIQVEQLQDQTVYDYDLDTEQVQQVTRQVPVMIAQGTGEYERRLKSGVRFDEQTGKFYRTRTAADVSDIEISQGLSELPQWVMDRLP